MPTYFKNTELADRYKVSEATVRNWVRLTKKGRLTLDLAEVDGHTYVTKSISNLPIIEELVERNRKYRNRLASKVIEVDRGLFSTFTDTEVYELIRNIELHHEIPRQYGYFESGAKEWDAYANKQIATDSPNMLRATVDLLEANRGYIDKRLAKLKKVNVIDIGVGNALPVKSLLAHLIKQHKIVRYAALDFSDDMLGIARRNIDQWFGGRIQFEGYKLDVTHERFANIVAEDYLSGDQYAANLVLFLGGTPGNLRVPSDAFRTVCESMNPKDLFIYTDGLTPSNVAPEWFLHSYETKPQVPEILPRHRYVLDKLSIEDSFYRAEMGFDDVRQEKYLCMRLNVALRLKFTFDDGVRAVDFEKGDTIMLWRDWYLTPQKLMDQFEGAGLYTVHSSQSEDRNYILTIAQIKSDI